MLKMRIEFDLEQMARLKMAVTMCHNFAQLAILLLCFDQGK